MNYPSITQYIDAIDGGRDFFLSLPLAPILCRGDDGEPIYSSGNFGVVFKAQVGDELRALKCFTRHQQGRSQAYAQIADHLPRSPYLINHQFVEQEILVLLADEFEAFPVLSMDWIEGRTLGSAIVQAAEAQDVGELRSLSKKFDDMALWLLGSGIAHGDLKPDNILITETGELRLVDYDGIYLPSMEGEPQREVGTPSYQHPLRCEMPFSSAIDHYPIALLSFTLRCLAHSPSLYAMFGGANSGALLFEPAELVSGRSAAFDFVCSAHIADGALMRLVDEASADLKGLSEALVEHVPLDSHNMIPFEHNGRWGFCDLSTNEQIAPIYDKVEPFSEGFAAVKIGRRWGYIDQQGQVISPFVFHDAWSFSQGLALVKRRGKYGFIDTDGLSAIAAKYDFARSFSCDLAAASVGGLYGYIDRKGRWKIKPIYSYAESLRDGVARVERDGVKQLLDTNPDRSTS